MNSRMSHSAEEGAEGFPPDVPASHREAFVGACRGLLNVVESALENVDINIVDSINATLLHWACFKKQVDVVKYLLVQGINTSIRTTSDGQTALHWACAGGDIHVLHLLSKYGLTGYQDTDTRGYTALHVAAQNGHFNVIHYLCLQNTPVDPLDHENVTPLIWGAMKGHLEIVRYLRSCGADASKQDVRGFTALHWAVATNHYAVSHYLANEYSLQHTLKMKDIKGQTPKAIALKDKPAVYQMLAKAEVPRKLTNFGYKFMWFMMPTIFYAIFYALQSTGMSNLYLLVLLGATLFIMARVIRPAYRPPRDCDPLMIGVFYPSVTLTFWYWYIYSWDQSVRDVGLYYAWLLPPYTISVLLLHFYLVKADPGSIKINKSADSKAFIDEIERGMETSPICSSCLIRKPLRSKHDAVTDKCVARFDHYCIWIFNSVGNDNHFKFMIMLTMVCWAHWWAFIHYTIYIINSLPNNWIFMDILHILGQDALFTYIIGFQLFNGSWEIFLLLQQVQMIMNNVTVNEITNWINYKHFWKNGNREEFFNPFRKSKLENFRAFLHQSASKDWHHTYNCNFSSLDV